MQRGILTLTKDELKALLQVFDVTKYPEMHLVNKLQAAMDSQIDPVSLEISEDELEVMNDEFAIPSPSEPESMKGVRQKFTTLMMNFRGI
ncbi:MAG TPA: hypothetical protein PLV59_02420 [Candidatus Dojkabacteria bacterium]|nr:hypothetical protein [Candidatus Dojkabacteria bacterium]